MQFWAGDEVVLRSEHTGHDLAVSVAVPHRYDASAEAFPVVVVLDAHWLFGTVRDLATSLAMSRQVPRAIVVGVGWPTTDLAEVAVVDLASRQVRQVTLGRGSCEYPSWAPSGRHLVFACGRGRTWQITVADRLGQTVRALTGGSGLNEQPDWGP